MNSYLALKSCLAFWGGVVFSTGIAHYVIWMIIVGALLLFISLMMKVAINTERR